jgi:putative intracellular protease/amidase
MAADRILVVTTSHGELGATGHRTGVWLEELATPYYALSDAGAGITLASIWGGSIPIDPRSIPAGAGQPGGEQPEGLQDVSASVRRFLGDARAMKAARVSVPIDDIADEQFDAVLLPGGHGAMWDMPASGGLARLVGRHFEMGKVVAAVCHGPAGLVSAKRRDGRAIVEGRRVNGFTNSEEKAVGLTEVVPFLLEDRMTELGGKLERGPDWHPYAVRDRNLITGQNPQSSELVARHVLEALGLGARATS